MPPKKVIEALEKDTGRLVNIGAAPGEGPRRVFTPVKYALLAGSPKVGGFGVLPLREHIRGRHAKWGARLLCGEASVPWVRIGRAILCATRPFCSDPLALCAPGGSLVFAPLPPPLARLRDGLRALPPIDRGVDLLGLVQPGPWCFFAPIWNPLLVTTRLPASIDEQPPPRGARLEPGQHADDAALLWRREQHMRARGLSDADIVAQLAALQQALHR